MFKNRLIGLLLYILLLASPLVGQTQFLYSQNADGTLSISGYPGGGSSVVIPGSYQGYYVTGIGEYALAPNQTSVRSIVMNNNITFIRNSALVGCINLVSVAIGNNVQSIGAGAFASCGMTNITIPATVISIGQNAFRDCNNLTTVRIDGDEGGSGAGEITIGTGAFADLPQLNSINLPNRLTSLGDGALSGNSGLTTIYIGNGLKRIGVSTFSWCNNLTSVTFGSSVASIGTEAFSYCTSLSSINIPNTVTSIETGAFKYCTNLTSVTIPNGSIGDLAFFDCLSLASVTLGNGVTSIGIQTFDQCPKLISLTIPSSVTNIGSWAFSPNLTSVFFMGNAPAVGNAFNANNIATVYYLPGTSGWGPTFAGRPTALWTLPNPVILNNGAGAGIRSNKFSFTMSWATNVPVVVDACTSLTASAWSPIATNTLSGGTAYFSDPYWTNYPGRFYRVRPR